MATIAYPGKVDGAGCHKDVGYEASHRSCPLTKESHRPHHGHHCAISPRPHHPGRNGHGGHGLSEDPLSPQGLNPPATVAAGPRVDQEAASYRAGQDPCRCVTVGIPPPMRTAGIFRSPRPATDRPPLPPCHADGRHLPLATSGRRPPGPYPAAGRVAGRAGCLTPGEAARHPKGG
jgi:hypothetical protein